MTRRTAAVTVGAVVALTVAAAIGAAERHTGPAAHGGGATATTRSAAVSPSDVSGAMRTAVEFAQTATSDPPAAVDYAAPELRAQLTRADPRATVHPRVTAVDVVPVQVSGMRVTIAAQVDLTARGDPFAVAWLIELSRTPSGWQVDGVSR